MFSSGANGKNKHRHRLSGKPVLYDYADAERGLQGARPSRWARRRPTKRAVVVLLGMLLLGMYAMRWWNERNMSLEANTIQQEADKIQAEKQREADDRPKPPLFERWHQAELALPQHHVVDPFANGKKYLWVGNHVHGESIA